MYLGYINDHMIVMYVEACSKMTDGAFRRLRNDNLFLFCVSILRLSLCCVITIHTACYTPVAVCEFVKEFSIRS